MTVPTCLMLLLLLQQLGLSRPQCSSCVQASCDCSRQRLREVPSAPPQLVTELNLSFNRLKTITNDAFLAYGGLMSLNMENNAIKTIEERAFVPLIHLKRLDLSSNRLGILSAAWFEKLSSLEHLNLLNNQYIELGDQGKLFQPLKSLKSLFLGGPNLYKVRKGDFSGLGSLEELTFDGKNLEIYEEGSFRQIGPIKHVAVGLNGAFRKNRALVEAVLSDVLHPNSTLTFMDTSFISETQVSPLKVFRTVGKTGVDFKNVNLTLGACVAILNVLSNSNITLLSIQDARFILGFVGSFLESLTLNHLEEIFLRNLEVPNYYSFPALVFLLPLLNTVHRVSVLNCRLFAVPCQSTASLQKARYIDFSDNILSDMALSELLCDGTGVLRNLQTINISSNHLLYINSRLFTKLDRLENIDMSRNAFRRMPETCSWPPNLRFLNLSSTQLRELTACLPPTLRILDVSDNALSVFTVDLPLLTELFISGNRLGSLPDGSFYPQLLSLSIQNNDLQVFSSKNLNGYPTLKRLEAAANTYVCSCEFVTFMMSDLRYRSTGFSDELDSYVCESPDDLRGERVAEARLSVFECHAAVALSLLCLSIVAVMLLLSALCHKFSILWYVRMTWAWLRAKRKPKLKKGELQYDAFVSYSEMDSAWVETHLVPEIEEAQPPLQLCLHKRDFIPGGWILDNIMDAIEKSHRTLFVLSENFVQSEWCKYELDYTHFRLFDQNDDTVVLVLLETIDTETIPKKFCKLRRFMNSRTYLEWPNDDNLNPRFWQSLRAAIKRPDIDYRNDENETVGL